MAIGARQKSMALEYDFYGEADVSVEELASLIAGALGGVVVRDDEVKGKNRYRVLRYSLDVAVYRLGSNDDKYAETGIFNFPQRIGIAHQPS